MAPSISRRGDKAGTVPGNRACLLLALPAASRQPPLLDRSFTPAVLSLSHRLLDDNRELYVPELQEVVRPHPHFMLFATQNPPGIYAGRKTLSRWAGGVAGVLELGRGSRLANGGQRLRPEV